MSTTIGIKLDDETRDRLQTLAGTKDRSSHWIMKKAIREYIEREEVYEKERQEDLERWQAWQETGEAVSASDMNDWFDRLEDKAKKAQPR